MATVRAGRIAAMSMGAVLTLVACTSGKAGSSAPGDATQSTASAEESPSPLESAIVFCRFLPGDDHGVLYRVNAGSWEEQRIRELTTGDCPVLSPDGTRFAVPVPGPDGRLTTAIFTSDGTGYTLLPLLDPTLQIGAGAWSIDGMRLASDSWDDTDPSRVGIYSRNTSTGGGLLRLTDAGSRYDFPLAFSPDGSKFLFLRPHAKGETGDREPMDVLVVSDNGTGLVRLNPSEITGGLVFPVGGANWSPDGRRVVFVGASGPFWESDSRAVFVVAADGTDLRRITDEEDILTAVWSPDGEWIAFDMGHPHELFVVHPDGTGLTEVTTPEDGLFSFGPVWSPDSTKLLFARGEDGFDQTELWAANADGSELTQITHTSGGYTSYAWAPSPEGGS